MSEPSDIELLRRIVAEQDRDGFRVLYGRHEAAAFSLALHVTGEEAVAEEAVQDAMVRVWKYAKAFDEKKGTVRTWLLRIVARQSMERIMAERKRRREHAEDEEILQNRAGAGASAAEADAERGELLGALRAVVGRLPVPERRMVALYYGGGLSQEEIAETMAMPKRTVSYRLQKALEQLREDLTRAGFAAAAPLLAGDRLAEALCGGAQAPATLAPRVLEGVSRAHLLRASAEVSRRAAGYSWTSAVPWLLAAALALAVGGIWYAQQEKTEPVAATLNPRTEAPPANPAPVKATQPPANGTIAEPAHVDRVWTFKDGAPADLVPNEGSWTWAKEDAPWVGVMQVKNQELVSMLLPVKSPKRPFLLRAEYSALTPVKDKWMLSFCAFYGTSQKTLPREFYRGRLIHYTPELDPHNWHEVHTYFWDRYVCTYVDRTMTCVYTLSKPYPMDELFVAFGGSMRVRKVELHTLRENELPQDLQDAEALKKRLGDMKDAKNLPRLRLPDKKP
ncbi:MAG: sigma-70 family RNA polymerase sigma factor [Planctomycetes bacterium]|nr:sigma-70 family RNA polymerase sigma factor [Planctomycetota bacterium]